MTRQVTTLPVIEKTVADGNWDSTRSPIDRVIIHTMVGTAVGADARFNNPTQVVSAHYGVLLSGTIWHWVDEDNTAYHAGDYAVNHRSIGIEHEDNGDYNGVRPDVLYTASAKLVRDICLFYNIPIDRVHILKHSEVHATGCPDTLDIDRIVWEAASVSPSVGPGYPPTFEGQDVTKDGVHYKAYKNAQGVLLWKVEPPQTTTPPTAPPEAPSTPPPEPSTPPTTAPAPGSGAGTLPPAPEIPPAPQDTPDRKALKEINVIANHSSWLTYLAGRSKVREILKVVGLI